MWGGVIAEPEVEVVVPVSDAFVLAQLDDLEAQRLALKAAEARWLAEAERRKLYQAGGHASMYGLLRSRFKWSDGQCKSAMTIARAGDRFESLLGSLADGTLPTNHAETAGRAALALDRAGYPDVDADLGFHLNEAGLEHDQYSKAIWRWEKVAHPKAAADQAASQYERRHATVSVSEHGVTVAAVLDHVDGADVREIIANFVDAEFRADWEAAVAVHGDHVTPALLDRTDRQRQADAVVTICRTAAGASPDVCGISEPNVTIIVDERTVADTIVEFNLFPDVDRANPFTPPASDPGNTPHEGECVDNDRTTCSCAVCGWSGAIVPDGDPLLWSQRRCETSTGVVIDPYTAVLAVLQGYVRWMMVDRLGNPLSITSKQRFFTGPMREAVMSVSDRCICPGCRRRTGATQADHLDEHQHGGATTMTNGGPVCGKHNRFKSRHNYRPRRDQRGHWHLYDPHGNIVA
jgi:hypothetical protein